MPTPGFSLRFRWLATWLSLLAVCSALLAPASALAQEMRTGTWTGLCSAGMAAEHPGQASGDGGHCELCTLPGLGAGLPRAQAWLVAPQAPERAPQPLVQGGTDRGAHPAIRGPPDMS